MDNELEVIRHQMEEKRASLAEKLDALQEQVLETVHEATAAVSNTVRDVTEVVDTVKENIQETVEAVKGNLEETVETVKETFNVPEKIRQHPWVALAGGFAAGFAGGLLLGPSSGNGKATTPTYRYPETTAAPPESPPAATASRASSVTSGLTSQLGTAATEALNTIKGMAIGTIMGVLNEMVGQAVPPSMKSDVQQLFNDLNTRLGGKDLYDVDVFSDSSNESGNWKGETNVHGNQAEMGRPMGSAQR